MSVKIGIEKDEGETVWLGGIGVVYKISGSETDQAFSIIEHVIKPGTMTPPHRHTREHEFSYVLEGVLGAEVGGVVVHVPPGGFALKPKGVPHTFWNEGPGILRFLEFISPSGFEQFFREVSKLVPPSGPPDEKALGGLAAKYGLELNMERAPELMQRFKVQVFGPAPP